MVSPLPKTVEEANLYIKQAHAKIASVTAERDRANVEIDHLRQQIEWLKKQVFGKKSEKRAQEQADDGAQASLFDAECDATEREEAEEISVPEHTRKKGGRRPLPEHLPRVEETIDVAEEEKRCACGCEKHRMGEDVSEELEVIPAQIFVRRIIRPKYVCRKCTGSIVQAPAAIRPIPKCTAGPSMLAHIVTYKYEDHIPLCRLEKILARMGIDITRSNMSHWVMMLHDLCKPLTDQMRAHLLRSEVIQADETPIRVQQPGGGTARSYLWVYLGDHKAPYIVYDFQRGRSRAGPEQMLGTYRGYLQTDGYVAYEELCKRVDQNGDAMMRAVACWAHARRYFKQAEESGDTRAAFALDLIGKLYAVERQAKNDCEAKGIDALHARRLELRKELSVELLNQLFAWMDEQLAVLPQSPLGKALFYAQERKVELTRYASDGRLDIDNNAVERAIRPVAVGRKNWLFAGSERGGEAAATFFTLISSAKRQGVNPYEYLRDVFMRLAARKAPDLDELLPDRWKPTVQLSCPQG